ncbi:MAG: VWA domain-containing protein, partial [Victivallales bacterium]|nr:VWA domain-containing protein [Victivallales bacterium]
MIILRPYLLALILPLLYLCWRFPHRNRFVTLLRTLLFVSLVLAAAGLTWRMSFSPGYCIALVDRSHSMPQEATDKALAFLKELDATRPKETRFGILGYSAKTSVEKPVDATPYLGGEATVEDRDATFLAEALEEALRLIPQDAAARIIVLGDGQWNGKAIDNAFIEAGARGIPVDYRLWQPDFAQDIVIENIQAPVSVCQGESYVLSCVVNSPVECEAVVRLRKTNGTWSERTVALHKGMNIVNWSDRAEESGTSVYEAVVETPGFKDSYPQNNRAIRMVSVEGEKSILVISESPSGNLSRVLRELKFKVRTERPIQKLLTPELLASCTCVVLENVSATALGLDGMELLAMMVNKGSLGLVMTGGMSSFANGGYYKSPLEEILPVYLYQRQEERMAKVAMVVALDRSGSMSAPVGGVTKMDLANRASLEVFQMLKPDDEFGLLAVDSSSHTVIPMGKVANVKNAQKTICSIESLGGGIYTYTALVDATKMLMDSTAHVRHLILFADASDAEEPGKYRELLAKVTAAGITVSAIGLGTASDSDADFLTDIARRGSGQVYFTDRADDLPRVFAEDTYKVALNTFLKESVNARMLPALKEVANIPPCDFSFGGYNLLFPREGATVGMVTT